MANYDPIVFFDLETTGIDTDACHIIQLAAVCGDLSFNTFIMPRVPITAGAAQVNGFEKRGRRLFRHNVPVRTTGLYRSLNSFIHFLYSCGSSVQLAAHNARRFDVPILARVLRSCGLWGELQEVVSGIVDTLPLSRHLHPYLHRYNQPFLVQYFLEETYDSHDAEEDATMLERLYNHWDPDERDVWYFTDDTDKY